MITESQKDNGVAEYTATRPIALSVLAISVGSTLIQFFERGISFSTLAEAGITISLALLIHNKWDKIPSEQSL